MPKYEVEAMAITMFIKDVFKLSGHIYLAGKVLQLDEQIKMMLKDACALRANVRELEAKIPGHRPIIFADYPPYQGHIQDLEDEYLVLEHEVEALRAACCILEALKCADYPALARQMFFAKNRVGRIVARNCALRASVRELEAKIPGQRPAFFSDYSQYRWLMRNRDQCTEADEAWLERYAQSEEYAEDAWDHAIYGLAYAGPVAPSKKV
jgi:hypothetical protein